MPEDENHQQFLTVIDIVGCGTPSYRTFTDNVEIVLRYSHICNAVKRRVTNPPTQYVIRGYPLEQSFRNLIVVNIVASRYYPLLCTVMLQRRIKLGTSLFPFKNIFLHVQPFLCHDGEPIPIVSAPPTPCNHRRFDLRLLTSIQQLRVRLLAGYSLSRLSKDLQSYFRVPSLVSEARRLRNVGHFRSFRKGLANFPKGQRRFSRSRDSRWFKGNLSARKLLLASRDRSLTNRRRLKSFGLATQVGSTNTRDAIVHSLKPRRVESTQNCAKWQTVNVR